MKKIKIILFFVFTFSIGANIYANDSIIKAQELNSTKTVVDKPKTEKNESSNGYIIALIGLLGVGLGSLVTYRIGLKQNKYKLAEIKLEILKSRKEKIVLLKHEIHNRQVDISGTVTKEIIENRFIERLLQDISSVIKNSELFDLELITDLKSYSQRLNNYAYSTKSGQPIDDKAVIKDLEKVPFYDNSIKTAIDKKLSDVENQINSLVNE
jgi:hypothetical protein